ESPGLDYTAIPIDSHPPFPDRARVGLEGARPRCIPFGRKPVVRPDAMEILWLPARGDDALLRALFDRANKPRPVDGFWLLFLLGLFPSPAPGEHEYGDGEHEPAHQAIQFQ